MTFLGLLTLILITLKLTGVIGWSWWFVVSPLLVLLFLFIVLVAGSIIVGQKMIVRRPNGKRRPF